MEKHRGLRPSTPSYRTEHLLATVRNNETTPCPYLFIGVDL